VLSVRKSLLEAGQHSSSCMVNCACPFACRLVTSVPSLRVIFWGQAGNLSRWRRPRTEFARGIGIGKVVWILLG
jgi:hypothetical protein